jgi:hypothetical protein
MAPLWGHFVFSPSAVWAFEPCSTNPAAKAQVNPTLSIANLDRLGPSSAATRQYPKSVGPYVSLYRSTLEGRTMNNLAAVLSALILQLDSLFGPGQIFSLEVCNDK